MIKIPESEIEFRNALIAAAKVAVRMDRVSNGKEKGLISQRAAKVRFTSPMIKRWEENGLVHGRKIGERNATIWYNVIELEAAAQAENLAIFLR